MSFSLSNGHPLPEIGLGTFRTPDGQTVIDSIHYAFQVGYRNIDTASLYRNEKGIGRALKTQALPRDTYSITTKVWNTEQGYDGTMAAFEASRKRLGVDYIDLYLIHWPVHATLEETWRAMELLYKSGWVRAIGVSNFSVAHLTRLMDFATIPPMVNQIEFHPLLQSPELVQFCQDHQILVQAWAPIMRGQVNQIPLLNTLAQKYNTTAIAVCLAWIKARKIMSLPKSQNPERIKANIEACALRLSLEDIEAINALDSNHRLGPSLDHFWRLLG